MKKKILYNRYYEKFDDFKEATLGFFENFAEYKVNIRLTHKIRNLLINI